MVRKETCQFDCLWRHIVHTVTYIKNHTTHYYIVGLENIKSYIILRLYSLLAGYPASLGFPISIMHPFHAICTGSTSKLPSHPSLPSVPPILTPNPPPTCWVGVGGGVNNNLSIFSAVHEISLTFEILPPPPNSPGNPPPPGVGWINNFFLLVSGQFMTFPGLFIFDPLTPPPPRGTLIFLGSLCQCLSDETLKAVGPFYLVSMPGEVNDPTSPHWNV